MLSPLRLDDASIPSLNIRTMPMIPQGTVATRLSPEPKVTWDIAHLSNSRQYHVFMRILVNQNRSDYNRYGYSLNLHIWGRFSISDEIDKQKELELLNLNAPSILYGAARGIVAQIFAMSYVGKVLLPSLNFVELIRENQRRGRRMTANSVTNDTKPPGG